MTLLVQGLDWHRSRDTYRLQNQVEGHGVESLLSRGRSYTHESGSLPSSLLRYLDSMSSFLISSCPSDSSCFTVCALAATHAARCGQATAPSRIAVADMYTS